VFSTTGDGRGGLVSASFGDHIRVGDRDTLSTGMGLREGIVDGAVHCEFLLEDCASIPTSLKNELTNGRSSSPPPLSPFLFPHWLLLLSFRRWSLLLPRLLLSSFGGSGGIDRRPTLCCRNCVFMAPP